MPKLFIYGGCVSRDTKEFFPVDWKASTYIARQSMISANSGPVELTGESQLRSSFQQRMIEEDIRGNLFQRMEDSLQQHDLFVFDIIIERRGVYELSPGKYVTRSYEMVNSKLISQLSEKPRIIEFGTEEHFSLWSAAADRMATLIHRKQVPTVALVPPWASVSNEGNSLTFNRKPMAEINSKYHRYNDYLGNMGISLLSIPDKFVVADENHKWGRAQFHYVEGAYISLRDQILDYYTHAGTVQNSG